MCPSCRLPGSVSAAHGEQQHPQVFPMCLGQEDKVSVVQSSAPLCRAVPLPVLHPKTTQTLRQEDPPRVTVLWSRTSRHSAGQGGGGVVCMCVCACMWVHALPLSKNLLLVWNSSRYLSRDRCAPKATKRRQITRKVPEGILNIHVWYSKIH